MASPLEWCEARDRVGIYARARSNELLHVPGVNARYEAPRAPAIALRPDESGFEEAAAALVALLQERSYLEA